MTGGFAAVVLAGGAGRRLGGTDKPALPVRGAPMLRRVLAAVADADPCVVVGPPRAEVPPRVRRTSEAPPGGGPVAAIAAGLTAIAPADAMAPAGAGNPTLVALLAADLPFLTSRALADLRTCLTDPLVDGALYVDDQGRHQTLCGVWRRTAVTRRLAEIGAPAGRSTRELFDGLRVVEVYWRPPVGGEGPPPWFDCDTEEDLRRAEGWPG